MDNFLGFIAVASAIIASMGLAMWLEWCCLSWLMRLMPRGQAEEAAAVADAPAGVEAENPAKAVGRAA